MRKLLPVLLALCLVRVASGQLAPSLSCTTTAGPTQIGVNYSDTCTASGGLPPYTWSISSGALPAGLTATNPDNADYLISGTPTTAAVYNYTVQVSDSLSLTAEQNYAGTVFGINGISPTSVAAGQPGFTLTVNGAGFGSDSVVNFNGNALTPPPANITPTQITVTVPMNLTTLAGTYSVTVTSGGATSNAATIILTPTITSLSPNTATAGGPSFTLTVIGTGFQSGATVTFNGTTLSTIVANPAQLTASIPASLIASTGTFSVTVTSAGVLSNAVSFTVGPPPSISSISPTSVAVGNPTFTLSVNGSNFGSGSSVSFNGNSLTATVVSSSQVTASVPTTLVANTGTFPVTVTSGGVPSNAVNFTVNAPTVTSIDPTTVTAGGPQFVLTVDGTNFINGSVVLWTESGATTILTANYVSSTELTTSVPSALIAAPGTIQITVKTNNSTSNGQTLTVVAGPALNSIDPNTITAGFGAFNLTANGTGFASGAAINWNGNPLTTAFQSPNELTATVPANLVASAGTAQVNVSSGGAASNTLTFTIVLAPTISSITPDAVTAGTGDVSLTVNGSGFASGASVKWNGNPIGTVFVGASQLTATVPASDVAHPGTAHVTVSSGGVSSNAVTFTIVAGPALTSLSPNSTTAGSPAFTLTVTGTGFASTATVLWNGSSSLSTTFHSATQLTATVPANLIASPGTASVTVKSSGVSSNALNFTVVAGPSLTSLSPTAITAGTGAGLGAATGCPASVGAVGTLTINGSGFASGAAAEWNGQALTTNVVNATQLSACVPKALVQGYGAIAITVVQGHSTTNALQISLLLPAVSLTGLQSTSAPTQNLEVGIQLASATPTALQGTLQLSFSSDAPGLPAGYVDPGLQFSSGGTTLTFTVPAGASSATEGAIQQGTVEGNIVVTLTGLTSAGTNVLPSAVSGTVAIPPLPPVITAGSAQITNLTSSGFDVVLTGYSVTRDMTTANFSFTASAGTAFTGSTTFSVPVSSAFSAWFDSSQGQSLGSMFELTVPFTISGPTSVLGSVSVTLTNSVGTSAAESASP